MRDIGCVEWPRTHNTFRDEISECANRLARTTLQVETLRAIIEDGSDEDDGQPFNHADQQHQFNLQVGFSVAAAVEPHASLRAQLDAVPESVSDDALSAANREQTIISALDLCVQEMAALDPQEKLVHCATVLQVAFPLLLCPKLHAIFSRVCRRVTWDRSHSTRCCCL